MKKLLLTVALITAPVASNAAEVSCEQVGSLAETIMNARQKSDNFGQMMQIAGDFELAKIMTRKAFDTTRFSTEKFREKAVAEFRTKYEIACYDLREGK